jgi:hypothetical protein
MVYNDWLTRLLVLINEDELGILSANFDDGANIRIKMTGPRGLSDDLIDIGDLKGMAHQLAAASGHDNPFKEVKFGAQLLKGVQEKGQRASFSASVRGGLDIASLIDQSDVQTHGTEIDSHMQFCHRHAWLTMLAPRDSYNDLR